MQGKLTQAEQEKVAAEKVRSVFVWIYQHRQSSMNVKPNKFLFERLAFRA